MSRGTAAPRTRYPAQRRLVADVLVAAVVGAVLSIATVSPAYSAPVTTTIDGITYEGDDANVGAGVVVTAYDAAQGPDPVIPTTVDISGTTYTVTAIGDDAFRNKFLSSVDLPTSLRTIGDRAFLRNSLASIVIPDGVTTIGMEAFSDNSLASAIIPDSVSTIGMSAFYLNSIASIVIPESVVNLEANAFASNELTSATIPTSMSELKDGIFYSNRLTSVSIPAGVTSIGVGVFAYNLLDTVAIPSAVQTIADDAFYGNQLESVAIPSAVSAIGVRAFAGSPLLHSVHFDGDAPTVSAAHWISGSFGDAAGKVLYFTCAASGFTTPTWEGSDSEMRACPAPDDSHQIPPTGPEHVMVQVLVAGGMLVAGAGLLAVRRTRMRR